MPCRLRGTRTRRTPESLREDSSLGVGRPPRLRLAQRSAGCPFRGPGGHPCLLLPLAARPAGGLPRLAVRDRERKPQRPVQAAKPVVPAVADPPLRTADDRPSHQLLGGLVVAFHLSQRPWMA